MRELAGIPLVGWAARNAVRARRLAKRDWRIVCSTDDPEIGRAAREWGAETPFERPAELAADTASSESVVLHALEALEKRGASFDAVVRLQPTAPLTAPEDVEACVGRFLAGDGRPVTTVVPARPPSWTYGLEGGRLREIVPEPPGVVRRQDLPDYYAINGAVSVSSPARLRQSGQMIEPDSLAVPVPSERGFDVDTEADLALCEAMLARRSPAGIVLHGERRIGPGEPVYVIAEAGVNHNGDVALAEKLVAAAAEAGADAVKFQTWSTEKLLAPDAPLAAYQERNTGGGSSQFEMIRRLELPASGWPRLREAAARAGITFLSTPDEEDSADLLERLGVPAFKIGSAELTNLDLLRHVARKGRPLIVSTGMATLLEVERAVLAIEEAGDPPLALLHCVSDYPCAPEQSNLRAIDTLRQAFGRPAGLSDHSLGYEVAVAAVARGASVLEKHLTLDTGMPGPDHAASLNPEAFAAMVRAVRSAERALGDGRKQPTPAERVHRPLMRKRWVASRSLPAGTRLTRQDLTLRRGDPAGLDPAELELLLGRELGVAVEPLETLTLVKLR